MVSGSPTQYPSAANDSKSWAGRAERSQVSWAKAEVSRVSARVNNGTSVHRVRGTIGTPAPSLLAGRFQTGRGMMPSHHGGHGAHRHHDARTPRRLRVGDRAAGPGVHRADRLD